MTVRTAHEFLDKYWNYELPVSPKTLAENAGLIVIKSDDLAKNNISGKIEDRTIFINPRESQKRQRFTIAHELGHYVLNHGTSFRDPAANFYINNHDPKEVEANRFAAEILMPKVAVDYVLEKVSNNVESMADVFGVSVVAMRYRLKNLGLL